MNRTEIKKKLNQVFDDNLHTKIWHNILDWVIIGLIILSSLEVFLSTFSSISEQIGPLLKFVDIFTTIFFTIEVSLRIWAADMLNPKYKGFKGRLRYCFSFYGLIDILSTYPALYGLITAVPITVLKIFRVMRLLRIFRYMKSFKILGDAVASKKEELVISFSFLSILTVILSFLLYYAEHNAQPELCENAWQTLVWAFAKYLGDPGKIADFPMVTPAGHFIAAIVGALGIAIFAVPAGLISSGFLEVIEEERHREELEKNLDKLRNAFERKQDIHTLYQIMPPYLSIPEIQARMRLTEESIFETVDSSSEFRIINVASTIPVDRNPQDRLAVEHFKTNRPYGCMIDRKSKVTIVSPSNIVDPVIGHFAYYVAKIGGFNYVSRELGETRPYRSFYMAPDGVVLPGYKEFVKDIDSLTTKKGSWVISFLAASGTNEQEFPEQVHFGYGGSRGDSSFGADDLLISDIQQGDELMKCIEGDLKEKFDVSSDRQKYHQTNNPKVFIRHLKNRANINGLVVRVAWSLSCHDTRRTAIAKTFADSIKSVIEPDHVNEETSHLKEKGVGYAYQEI